MRHNLKRSALCAALPIATFIGLLGVANASRQESSTEIEKRLQASAEVLMQVMSEPDKTIPADVLANAKCVVVIPSLIKFALGVGARHGKGFATCRTSKRWSAPGPISINGGSIGLQIGTQTVDIILVILDQDAFKELLLRKITIGSEVTGMPGPVGKVTDTNDWRNAKILSYSRSHGLFAGVTLKGASLKQDKDGIVQLYRRYIPIEALLEGKVSPPQKSQQFLAALRASMSQSPTAQ